MTKLWQGVVLKRLTRPKYSLSDSFETSDSKPGFSNCNFEIFEFEKKNPKLTVCALLKPITKSHWRAERELIIIPDQTPTNNQFMSKASVTNFARISEEYRENQLRNIQFSCRQSSEYLKVSVFYFVEERKYIKYQFILWLKRRTSSTSWWSCLKCESSFSL